jgi:transposase-like protein
VHLAGSGNLGSWGGDFEGHAMAQRKRRDAVKERQWRRAVREQTRSGRTIRAYCQEHGLAENSSYFWRQEFRRRAEKSSAQLATFTPVTVVDARHAEPGPTLEIVLPDEVRVRLFAGADSAVLREVLAVLRGASC